MQDILLDSAGDIIIDNGDFKIGESLAQEVSQIISLAPGNIRADGYLGVDIWGELLNEGDIAITQKLKSMLKRDNKKLKNFSIDKQILNIDVEQL